MPIFLIILVDGFDYPAPGLTLIVVDLAEVEHRPLHHLATGTALALHYAPIAVFFAVFDPSCESQVHANGFYGSRRQQKDTWSSLHAIAGRGLLI